MTADGREREDASEAEASVPFGAGAIPDPTPEQAPIEFDAQPASVVMRHDSELHVIAGAEVAHHDVVTAADFVASPDGTVVDERLVASVDSTVFDASGAVVVEPAPLDAVLLDATATGANEASGIAGDASANVASSTVVVDDGVRDLVVVPQRMPARIVGSRVRSGGRRAARAPRAPSRASRRSRIAKLCLAALATLGAIAFLGLQVRRAVAAGVGDWVAGDVRAGLRELRGVAWDEPVRFADGLAGDGATTRIAIEPDGRLAVVAHGERGRDATLWLAEIAAGRVVTERPITEIDEPGDELAPWFDGETLWFASDRAGGRGGLDLWSARFVDGGFEGVERLPGDVNSSADDTDPTVQGTRLVFASARSGDFDLWSAASGGGPAARIEALASPSEQREPALSRDGGSLWFAERTATSFDLARSFRDGDRWLPSERVDALSTAVDERSPLPLGNGLDVAFLRQADATSVWRAGTVEVRMVRPPAWTTSEIALLVSLVALALLAWAARDVSRYDVLIAAWAASILVHVALLLALGELRATDPPRGAGDGGGEPFELRVTPSSRSSTLTGGGGDGAGALERASTDREIAGGAPASGRDLSAELTTRSEVAPVPGRAAASTPLAATGALPVEEAVDAGIPRAELAASSAPLPSPGRTQRSISADGASASPERFAFAGAAGAGVGATSTTADSLARGAGAALVLEAGPSSAPAAERGAPMLAAGTGSPRAVEEGEPAGNPVAASDDRASGGARDDEPAGASGRDALALLGPGTSERSSSEPTLERYERAGSGPRGDALPTGGGIADAAFAPGGPSLVDDIPRGGAAVPDSAPRIAATPYQTRTGPAKQRALDELGGTTETEAAVANGLAYLARIQGELGQWGPLDHRDEKYGEICVGKTALATLAFLAAGHTHVSNTVHSKTVERALAFLLAVQDPESGHYGDTASYSHGIATFALAEALATTHDESLRESVERAVAHVLERQSRDRDPRKFGGWPYYYVDPNRSVDPWPRTSITAWQVLALESARLSGVDVPDRAFDDAARFLDAARDERGDWYRYSHEPARLRSQYPTLPASTPAALFALSCVGRDVAGPEHAAAREYVLERAPRGYRYTNERDFVERGQGNPYFWYQGTLAMIRVGGNAWKRWNVALQETLLPAQEKDGSWRPIDVYARYARDDERDRAYTTALCVLCLEVYYRYDLPLLSAGRGRAVVAPTSESAGPR